MNAERLHAIAIAIKEEIRATDQVALVRTMAESLQHALDDPSQPNFQVQVTTAREQLEQVLAKAPSNGFSPAWRETVEELGVVDLLGERLLQRIEEIFLRNEVTPAGAASEADSLATELEKLDGSLDYLLAGLGYFDIGSEELRPGEFEVGFLIPRSAVKNELGHLGKELVELKKILRPSRSSRRGHATRTTSRSGRCRRPTSRCSCSPSRASRSSCRRLSRTCCPATRRSAASGRSTRAS